MTFFPTESIHKPIVFRKFTENLQKVQRNATPFPLQNTRPKGKEKVDWLGSLLCFAKQMLIFSFFKDFHTLLAAFFSVSYRKMFKYKKKWSHPSTLMLTRTEFHTFGAKKQKNVISTLDCCGLCQKLWSVVTQLLDAERWKEPRDQIREITLIILCQVSPTRYSIEYS